jgi:hypothetical protein
MQYARVEMLKSISRCWQAGCCETSQYLPTKRRQTATLPWQVGGRMVRLPATKLPP